MDGIIRVSHYCASTNVLGPGTRFALWLQGCEKRCPKCINPEGRDLGGGYLMPIGELITKIKAQEGINGITISGGEPFLQFDMLELLVQSISRETGLDIMLYSGYELREIIMMLGNGRAKEFFSHIDIFVDGAYIDVLNTGSIYRGSDNQKFYFFTDKYAAFSEKFYSTRGRDIEFELGRENDVVMIGIPPKDFYGEFVNRIGEIKG